MKKKILATLMCCAMLLALVGCTEKEPTVQELLDGIKSIESDKYQDMGLAMTVSGEQDEQAMLLQVAGDVEMRGGLVHIYDMTMNMSVSGLNLEMSMEGWSDLDNDVSYANVTALGQNSGWTKSTVEDSTNFDVAGLLDKFRDLDAEDLALQEHSKGEDWVLTWTTDMAALNEMVSGVTSDVGGSGADFGELAGSAKFDEKTRELKAIEVTGSDMDANGVSDVSILFTFKTLNDEEKTLEIPAEVIDTAVEDSGDMFGFGESDELIYDTEPPLPEGDDVLSNVIDYDYSGTGGAVMVDGEGYDEIIDPMAETVAAADPAHRGVYVYHYDGMAQMNYTAGGTNWVGGVTVQHMDPDNWASAEAEFISNVAWLTSYYDAEPTSGSVEEKSVMFAKLSDGAYEIDLAAWNDNMYITAEMYTYNNMTADEAVEHLNEMLTTVGVN